MRWVQKFYLRIPGRLSKSKFKFSARVSVRVTRSDYLRQSDRECHLWKPLALRAPTLIGVMLLSAGLIVILQRLLMESRKDGGLMFAPDINKLPLSKSFWYLYLPTLIAVAYSLLWSWIDLSVKRLEPFYQLSQTDGALATNSLLLKYPIEFIPLVPFQAARRR